MDLSAGSLQMASAIWGRTATYFSRFGGKVLNFGVRALRQGGMAARYGTVDRVGVQKTHPDQPTGSFRSAPGGKTGKHSALPGSSKMAQPFFSSAEDKSDALLERIQPGMISAIALRAGARLSP